MKKKKQVRKSAPKKTANKKAKTTKKIVATSNVLSKYKQLRDGSYRIHNWKMRITPTEQFPDMVTIVNAKAEDESRRFVDATRAVLWIEATHVETLVDKGASVAQKELKTVGLGALVQTVES